MMTDMVAALNVYDALRSWLRGMQGNVAHWQTANPDASQIVGLVMRLEREYA